MMQRYGFNASGLEILVECMPLDLTISQFLNLNFGDVLNLRAVNKRLSQSQVLNRLLDHPFQGTHHGGSCQAVVDRLCGKGPHNSYITRVCTA